MSWQPWEDYKIENNTLPIKAPPCPTCKYWNPIRKFLDNGRYNGVRLCHSTEQYNDFSCYREKT